MQEPAPIAIVPDGSLMICGDGPELLTYYPDGQPAWKAFCDGVLVAVAGSKDHVVTGDHDGRVTWWRTLDGKKRDESQVGEGLSGMAVAADGRVAAVVPRGVALVPRGGEAIPWSIDGAAAVGFRADGAVLAVGTRAGSLRLLDVGTGASLGGMELGVGISGVAWSPRGAWVVSAGNLLFVVSADGRTLAARIDNEGPLGPVTLGADGVLGAAILGAQSVAVFELYHNRRVGQLDFRRNIGGVAFAPGGALGIGLDDGDASRVDLVKGTSTRTEPHPGRGRNTWNFDARVDQAAVRGALAMNRAGGAPIATYTGWKPEGGGWFATCLGCSAGLFVFLCFAVGLVGLAWMGRVYGYY